MNQDYNLTGMWSEETKNFVAVAVEEIIDSELTDKVDIDTFECVWLRKDPIIHGLCGHNFVNQYLFSTISSRVARATVTTRAYYMGTLVNSSSKEIDINPGQRIDLGCTGFANESAGYDTEYRRSGTYILL